MNSKLIPSTMRLDDIDPAIAWQAWEPSQEEPWDHRRAALLHRRSGFAANAEQLQATVALKPDEIVAKMVRGEPIPSFEVGFLRNGLCRTWQSPCWLRPT